LHLRERVETTVPPVSWLRKNVSSSTSLACEVWRMKTISTFSYLRDRKRWRSRKNRLASSFIDSLIEPETSIRQNMTAWALGLGVGSKRL